MFSGMITSFFGFECQFSIKDAKADFLLCSKPYEQGCEILADQNAKMKLLSAFFTQSIWNRIQEFCLDWADVIHLCIRMLKKSG